MMEDLAMHMMEIIMNSIHANSQNIEVKIEESEEKNLIEMSIKDDGKGMTKELLCKIVDPFTTGRTTRKVGLGVSFMKGLTEMCDGSFDVSSEVGKGTLLKASVRRDNIDVPPMGDLGEMMMQCIMADEKIDFDFSYKTDRDEFCFSTKEIKRELDGVSLLEPEILIWIKSYINEGIVRTKEEM
ncbi:MAG: sensor histidine kinase [Firmicutes bacterium]|nr:sensor histidine kinase [Bacillota bacterium]